MPAQERRLARKYPNVKIDFRMRKFSLRRL